MAKKILAIALSLAFVFTFGFVAMADDVECPIGDEICACEDVPTNDEPTNDEPTNDEPTNDEPTNDQPTNDDEGHDWATFLSAWGWATLGSWIVMAVAVVIGFFVSQSRA